MVDSEQLAILKRGADAWNAWADEHPAIALDFCRANLSKANLSGADLGGADLTRSVLDGANLREANLSKARLTMASLNQADLTCADLREAELNGANLSRADLNGALLMEAQLIEANLKEANLNGVNLSETNLKSADLIGADLTGAILWETVLVDIDLSSAKGLDSCVHHGPSTIDPRTLARSGKLPLAFLRGVGLPDRFIEYLPSLLEQPIQFYACFISYSSKDQSFAERLHADLQDKGVRCWFAPHDLPIGAKTRPTIDQAIREYDKLLLVLSKNSVDSTWVEHEIERALAKELRTRNVVLFPVRLDDAIKTATSSWAREIYEDRNIGDLRRWRSHTAYQKAFDRLLLDLSAAAE